MSPRKKTNNPLHIAVLGFFMEKSNYGYDLYKYLSLETPFRLIWHIKQSQFYAILDSFYKAGYLEIELQSGGNYPDRKEYHLTSSGRDKFLEWIVSPVLHGREMRQEFLAKLYFALKSSKEEAALLIAHQKKESTRWLHQQEEQKNKVVSVFDELMVDYRIIQMQGMLDWLQTVERKIK